MKTTAEIAAQRRAHYLKNRERLLEYRRAQYEKNLESDRAKARAYAAAHRKERKLYDVGYRAQTREKRKVYAKGYNQRHSAERAAYQREYRRLHPSQKSPERIRIQSAVRNALRRGDLMRPTSCSRCLKPCKPQGHHADYSKPLEVTWLCKACHTLEHYPSVKS